MHWPALCRRRLSSSQRSAASTHTVCGCCRLHLLRLGLGARVAAPPGWRGQRQPAPSKVWPRKCALGALLLPGRAPRPAWWAGSMWLPLQAPAAKHTEAGTEKSCACAGASSPSRSQVSCSTCKVAVAPDLNQWQCVDGLQAMSTTALQQLSLACRTGSPGTIPLLGGSGESLAQVPDPRPPRGGGASRLEGPHPAGPGPEPRLPLGGGLS